MRNTKAYIDRWPSLERSVRSQRLVLFLGAGVSRDAPASLPLARELTATLVEGLAAAVYPRLSKAPAWLLSVIENVQHCAPEALYQRMYDDVGDSVVGALAKILSTGQPNRTHHLLSDLISSGRVAAVVTTNFDEHLERALHDRSIACHFIADESSGYGRRGLRILKVHGTTSAASSLIATLRQVGRGLAPRFARSMKVLLDQYPFIFLGWSDADVDLTPILVRGAHPFIWVEHGRGTPRLRRFSPARRDRKSKQFSSTFTSSDVERLLDTHGGWMSRGSTYAFLLRFCKTLKVKRTAYRQRDVPTNQGSWRSELLNWILSLDAGDQCLLLAGVCTHVGALPRARSLYRKAADSLEESGDGRRLAISLDNLGTVNTRLSKWSLALECFASAERLFRENDEHDRAARSLANGAVVLMRRREWGEAIAAYRGALRFFRGKNSTRDVADMCHNLAMAYRGRGRETRALALWRIAATLRSKMGDLEGLAETQNSISATYKRVGRLPTALRHVRKARVIFEMLGNQENIAYVLGNEADVLRRMNRAGEAVELLDDALSRARSVGNLWLCSLISRTVGRCYEQLEDRSAAARAYRAAYAFARANGDDDAARRSSNALAAVTAG